jgi:hypothetical protein
VIIHSAAKFLSREVLESRWEAAQIRAFGLEAYTAMKAFKQKQEDDSNPQQHQDQTSNTDTAMKASKQKQDEESNPEQHQDQITNTDTAAQALEQKQDKVSTSNHDANTEMEQNHPVEQSNPQHQDPQAQQKVLI